MGMIGEKRKRRITRGDPILESRTAVDQSLVVISEKGGDLEGMLNAVGVDIPVAERGRERRGDDIHGITGPSV